MSFFFHFSILNFLVWLLSQSESLIIWGNCILLWYAVCFFLYDCERISGFHLCNIYLFGFVTFGLLFNIGIFYCSGIESAFFPLRFGFYIDFFSCCFVSWIKFKEIAKIQNQHRYRSVCTSRKSFNKLSALKSHPFACARRHRQYVSVDKKNICREWKWFIYHV